MKVFSTRKIQVYINERAYYKMTTMFQEAKTEAGVIGTVMRPERDVFIIDDVMMPEQKAHAATCELLPDSLAEIAMSVPDPNTVRFWGHTHKNMGVFNSKQDTKQLIELAGDSEYFIAGIHNDKGEWHYALMEDGLIYDEISVSILISEGKKELLNKMKEIEQAINEYEKKEMDYWNAYAKEEVKNKVKPFKAPEVQKEYISPNNQLKLAEWNIKRSLESDEYIQLHNYFDEMASLNEIFEIKELAIMSLCEDVDELRKTLDELGIIHEWTDQELEDILFEVTYWALDERSLA